MTKVDRIIDNLELVLAKRHKLIPVAAEDLLVLTEEIKRLFAENKWLYDQLAAQKRTAGAAEQKP